MSAHLDGLQELQQGRPLVPGGVAAAFQDVVAVQGGDRDGGDLIEAEAGGEGLVVVANGREALGAVVDQVHLVDRQHHMADADQRDQVAVAPGLGQDPLAGVDEDHRHLRGGGAGDHVAGVLLVTGGVGDDELALVGGEEAVGDVDGDPLLALRLQAVEEQGVVDLLPLGADPLAVRLQCRQLVFEDQLRIPEHPADQGALAVVDAAAGDEAQQPLLFLALQVGVDVSGDQFGLMGHGKLRYSGNCEVRM